MKCLIIDPVKNFKLVEKEKPVATDKKAVIKVKYCAICGSDRRPWNEFPGMVIGHEFSGYIEDPGSFPFKKGARVCAAEFNPCGECEQCKAGKEHLCAQMLFDNPGVTAYGAFGEYVANRGDLIFELPDDVPLELGAIVEPFAVAVHGVRTAEIQPGQDLLIWGNGPIALYVALAAKLMGAGKVYMIGRNKGRVEFCNKYDFVDKCLSVKDDDFDDQLKAITPEGGFKCVMDCLGCPTYDDVSNVVARGGRIVMMGMNSLTQTHSVMKLYLKEISIRTSIYFTVQDYKDAFDYVCKNPDVFLSTITSRIPQDPDVVQAMFVKMFESGANDECKVVLEYED